MSSVYPRQLPLFSLDADTKQCSRCGHTKPLDAFFAQSSRKDGKHAFCKMCCLSYHPKSEQRKASPACFVGIGFKQCLRCDEVLPVVSFGVDKRRPDGLFPYCRRCRVKNVARYDERATMQRQGLRWCGSCRQWLPAAHFGQNRAEPSGRCRRCKDCSVKQADNRRLLAMKSRGSHTVAQWRLLKARYDDRCLRCGRCEPDIALTKDHITPLSRGGDDTIHNIQPLCGRCNDVKATKTLDFRPVLGYHVAAAHPAGLLLPLVMDGHGWDHGFTLAHRRYAMEQRRERAGIIPHLLAYR